MKRARPTTLLTESGRVEAFSDGVLAIAITLLVLDLHTDSERGHFGADLRHQYPTYLAYAASFAYIGVIWVNHHALFSRIAKVDPPLLWMNLYLLAMTSVLPFPTALLARSLELGDSGDRADAAAVYAVISALMASSWLFIYRHLARAPELLAEQAESVLFDKEQGRALAGIGCYALTAALAFLVPVAAAVLIFAMPVFYGLTSHAVAFRAENVDEAAAEGSPVGNTEHA